MPYRYFVFIALLLTAATAHAQCVPGAVSPANLQVTSVAATTATLTFVPVGGGGPTGGCRPVISYTYPGSGAVSVPYAMPLVLTGLPPATAITVTVVRYALNNLSAGPVCCTLPANTITFTTLAAPLTTAAAAAAGQFTLAPNPAQHRTTLTLAAAPLQPTSVLVLDALGRPVRQQVLPARATTAALEVAGLPAGLYSVRCGTAVRRLVVE